MPLKVGEALGECAMTRPESSDVGGRGDPGSDLHPELRVQEDRHLEVRVGNVETGIRWTTGFGSVVRAGTAIKVLINRNLDAVGRTGETELTAFTDGCSGLRNILADASVTTAPILDWFEAAKAVIVEEVERQHWRLWNGKAANAQVSIDCTHAVMHHFKGEADARKSAQLSPPSSVRNTPAADMAMNMRCGFPGSSKTECRHMPPAPGCQAGPVPCLRNPDSSCQVWPPSLDWNNAASSIPAWRWCTCRKAGDLAPVLSRYAMTRRRRTDFGRPAASIRFKDRHADGSLCLLRGETACAQPGSGSAPCKA